MVLTKQARTMSEVKVSLAPSVRGRVVEAVVSELLPIYLHV